MSDLMISRPIATVTLNPAIDLTAGVSGFRPGDVNRVTWEQSDPGGKGINVASFLASFAVPVTATGFLGADNIQPFLSLFAAKPISDRFVRITGNTRTNIKLVDDAAGADGITDINFPGFSVADGDFARLHNTLDELARTHGWFLLAGSLPDGAPDESWSRLLTRLRAQGHPVALDTSGPALAAAIDAGPAVIKPNRHELSDLLGETVHDAADAVRAAAGLHARGVETVIVSMGADGAVFSTREHALLAIPPHVLPRSTVGAGDAMVAGYLTARRRGLDLAGSARLATAFSLGAISTLGPRLPPPADVEARIADIRIEPL